MHRSVYTILLFILLWASQTSAQFVFRDPTGKETLLTVHEDTLPTLQTKESTLPLPAIATTLKTAQGKSFLCQLYQASSNRQKRVIVLGIGIDTIEAKRHYILEHLNNGNDVAIFTYAWNMPKPFLEAAIDFFNPIKQDFTRAHLEVQALVEYLRHTLLYTTIIGHCECYSALMFTRAHATYQDGSFFNACIIDTPIISIKKIVYAYVHNPTQCFSQISEDSSACAKDFTLPSLISTPIKTIVDMLMISDFSMLPYLEKFNIPVLFIHGKNDPQVSNEDFEIIWQATPSAKKSALITPYHHANSFRYRKTDLGFARKIYMYTVQQFIAAYESNRI